MVYHIIENIGAEQEEFLYYVADFFWNAGHDVYIAGPNEAAFKRKVREADCIVLLIPEQIDGNSALQHLAKILNSDFETSKHNFLLFGHNGVFTNIIPPPHKIYPFNGFCKNQFNLFFQWTKKMNLFQPNFIINNT
jgi:hypothetical protein